MKINSPKIVDIIPKGEGIGRELKGVFVLKHAHPENIGVVEVEMRKVLDLAPSKCLVLPEGLKKYRTPENLYIDRFVEENKIVAADPIVSPYNADIAFAIKESKKLAALAVLIDDVEFIYGLDVSHMSEDESQKWLEIRLKVLAEHFDIKPNDIQNGLEQLEYLRINKGAEFKERIKLFSTIRHKLISKSNQQSRKLLEAILRINKQPRIFAFAGVEHEPVFIDSFV